MAEDGGGRLHVQLVSPEQILFDADAEMVVCRTADGDIAFLPGHVPFLGALGIASVRVITPDGETAAAVHGGFVEVSSDRVIILSDVAELPGDIDVARAQAAKERAEQAVAANPDDEEAEHSLARALLRLEIGAGGMPVQSDSGARVSDL